MREMIRYAFILGVISLSAGGLLAGVNHLTSGRISAQSRLEEESALKQLMPEAASFEMVFKDGELFYYRAYDLSHKLIGVVIKASGKGYSSIIETMAAIELSGVIKTVKVLNQNETPGLGTQVAEPFFTDRFGNLRVEKAGEVPVISGASVSSRAMISSLKLKAEQVMEAVKNGK